MVGKTTQFTRLHTLRIISLIDIGDASLSYTKASQKGLTLKRRGKREENGTRLHEMHAAEVRCTKKLKDFDERSGQQAG